METTWWRRNRFWLALLLPLLLLALGASSFRLVTLYRPWQWTDAIVAAGPTGTLHQEFLGTDDVRHTRTVTVAVDGLRTVPALGADAAAPGATLWQVDLTLSAAPDQALQGCEIELVGPDGTRYATNAAGKVPADPDDSFWLPALVLPCVPEDAPGPVMGLAGLEPATVERPDAWPVVAAAAIPDGVEPTAVRIMWQRPTYLELTAPAS